MHARYPARKQRQPRNEKIKRENKEQKGRERGKKTKVGARIGRQDTKRSRGKGACNWTAKGTSPSLAARPARCGMVGRSAARRGATRALRCAAHGTARCRGDERNAVYDDDPRGSGDSACVYLSNDAHSLVRTVAQQSTRSERARGTRRA